jgi:hypothetical protein
VEAGGIEPPTELATVIEKVLDSPTKSRSSGDFPEHKRGPKMAQGDPDNPEKTGPGPVGEKGPQNK